MSHLLGIINNDILGPLDPLGAGLLNSAGVNNLNPYVAQVAPLVASYFLGPEAGAAMSASPAVGGALVGAGVGAGVGYANTGTGQGALQGGLTGGLSGYGAGTLAGAGGITGLAAGGSTDAGSYGVGSSIMADNMGTYGSPAMSSLSYGMPATDLGATAITPAVSTGGGALSFLNNPTFQHMLMGQQIMSGLGSVYGGLQQQKLASSLGQYTQQLQNNPYMTQLQQLEANPSSLQSTPGYEAAMQAAMRQSLAGGAGIGTTQAALGQIGGQLYSNQVSALSQLANQQQNQTQGAYNSAVQNGAIAQQSNGMVLGGLGAGLGALSSFL